MIKENFVKIYNKIIYLIMFYFIFFFFSFFKTFKTFVVRFFSVPSSRRQQSWIKLRKRSIIWKKIDRNRD